MENTILNRINSDTRSKELFTPVLGNNYAKTLSLTKQDEHDVYTTRWQKYKKDVKDTHSKAFKFTLAGGVTLVLGGAGIVLGRGKNYDKIIKSITKRLITLKEKKDKSFIGSVEEYSLKGLKLYFSFDKMKDFSFLKIAGAIPLVGEKIVKFSRWSEMFPKKTTHNNLSKLAEKLHIGSDALNKDIATINNIITEKTDNLAEHISKNYFPELKPKNTGFWDNLREKGRNIWNKVIGEKKDLVMSEWEPIIKELDVTVEGTQIGQAINALKQTNPQDAASKEILDLYDEAKIFIIDKHAGRIRDMALGGGFTEMLIPAIAGGILTKNTLKGKTPEEKSDNFVKGGGIGIAGGI